MHKEVMSGNEAVALGVYEAGAKVAAAYPGTPSTEILENIGAKYSKDIYSQWACNEKVAVEIISGASIGGVRSFAAFKHVGMNVATDPIFTMAYAGVNAGMVLLTADDPGCHSSQNEQDNRWYAVHAKMLMLEPSDSQECKDFTMAAFDLSEKFDTPVLIRSTTRVCHAKSVVEVGERREFTPVPYVRNGSKYNMLPGVARARHIVREQKLVEAEEYSNSCPFNRAEYNDGAKIGIVTSGISYQYAREVFGKTASYLKLGLTFPMPRKLISEFCAKFETIYVVEEGDPIIENNLKQLGIACTGKEKIPLCGELNAQIVREALLGIPAGESYKVELEAPARASVMCAGCPHRGFFFSLSKHLKEVVPVGDIGCYALGSAAPFNGFDYSICMGAGFSSLIGLSRALEAQGDSRKALGMMGDSTFFHSGITSLIDIWTSETNAICFVLDNSITGMTGHQDNPGTAKNLMGQPSPVVDIPTVIRAIGVPEERLRIVDPLDVPAVEQAIKDGCAVKGPFVVVTRRPCALIKEVARANAGKYCKIDAEKCKSCKACMKIACPAMAFVDGKATIADPASCTGCGLCMSQCKFGAIEKVGE